MKLEPIIFTLNKVGVDLIFSTFSIKGVPGFNTSLLYKGEQTLYNIESHNFSFQVSLKDVTTYNISIEQSFYILVESIKYIFKINQNPRSDLTGWCLLDVIIIP